MAGGTGRSADRHDQPTDQVANAQPVNLCIHVALVAHGLSPLQSNRPRLFAMMEEQDLRVAPQFSVLVQSSHRPILASPRKGPVNGTQKLSQLS